MTGTTIYMTIEGTRPGDFKGDIISKTRPNAIRCTYYSYAANVELHTSGSGGGASVGKAHRGPVIVHKAINHASPRLMQALIQGEHLKSVSLELRNGSKHFFTVVLHDVLITAIQHSAPDSSETPDAIEEIEFVFKQITFTAADGTTYADKAGNQ